MEIPQLFATLGPRAAIAIMVAVAAILALSLLIQGLWDVWQARGARRRKGPKP